MTGLAPIYKKTSGMLKNIFRLIGKKALQSVGINRNLMSQIKISTHMKAQSNRTHLHT
jgi:hypothetical protein